MGSRLMYNNPRTVMPSAVFLSGNFCPNNTSAIDQTTVVGNGFSVLYTSTGLFTITLSERWYGLYAAHASFALSTPTAVFPQWGAISVTGTASNTLQLSSVNGSGSATDIAANAANRIYFTLLLKNTGQAA